MVTFGQFVAEDLPWNGEEGVFLARQRGHKGEPNAVVKVFPRVVGRTPEATIRELQRVGAAFQVQHEAARNQERYVAPILEDRITPDGMVWQVTRRYPASAASLIQGLNGKPARPPVIWHLGFSAVSGAIALQHADLRSPAGSRRSHGNLKPTKILLGDPNGLPTAEAVVTQPAPGDAADAAEYELRDIEDIGRLIFQLVNGRLVVGEAEWPELIRSLAKPGSNWRSLGPRHAEWARLCRDLLEVRSQRQGLTLPGIEERLRNLEPRASSAPRRILIPVAAVVAVLGVGAWAWLRFSQPAEGFAFDFTSEPAGAEVRMKDPGTGGWTVLGTTPLHVDSPGVAPGEKRTVEARLTGPYQGLDPQTVEVTGGVPLSKVFTFRYGVAQLQVAGVAPGARVVVRAADEPASIRFSNSIPAEAILPPGNYVAEFSAPGRSTRSQPLTIAAGRTNTVAAQLPEPAAGTLEVVLESSLRDARFFEGNTALARFSAFAAGSRHTLQLRAPPPWTPIETNLALTATGIEGRKDLVFRVEPPHGDVTFQMATGPIPPNAQLWLRQPQRQRLASLTPADSSFTWPPGRYDLEVTADGFEPASATLVLAAGSSTNCVLLLKPLLAVVRLNANLPGAVLFSNGVPVGPIGTQARDFQLQPGREVQFLAGFTNELGELDPLSFPIQPQPSQIATHEFKFEFGTVELVPDSPEVVLSIEGAPSPLPKLRRYQRPGQEIRYAATRVHFAPQSFPVKVAAGEARRVEVKLAPMAYPLSIRFGPPEATLQALPAGTPWPAGATNVPRGSYGFALAHPTLGRMTTNLQVTGPTASEPVLWLRHGRVDIETSTPGLAVKVDGAALNGSTPLRGILLTPGKHTFQFSQPGLEGEPKVRDAVVEEVPFGSRDVAARPLRFDNLEFLPPNFTSPSGIRLLLVGGSYVSQFEVTRGQFNKVLGARNGPRQSAEILAQPAVTGSPDDIPLVNVKKVREFVDRLNAAEAANLEFGGRKWTYALPTVQEWQAFAAAGRAEARTIKQSGALAPAAREDGPRTPGGLQDVFGNAAEILDDNGRLLRAGGSISDDTLDERAISPKPLDKDEISSGINDLGFRVVLRPRP